MPVKMAATSQKKILVCISGNTIVQIAMEKISSMPHFINLTANMGVWVLKLCLSYTRSFWNHATIIDLSHIFVHIEKYYKSKRIIYS